MLTLHIPYCNLGTLDFGGHEGACRGLSSSKRKERLLHVRGRLYKGCNAEVV